MTEQINIKKILLDKKLNALYSEVYVAMLVSTLAAVLFSALLIGIVKWEKLIFWSILIAFSGFFQASSAWQFKNHRNKYTDDKWYKLYVLSSCTTAIAWSYSAIVCFNIDDIIINNVFVILLLGVAIGGALANIASENTARFFILTLVGALILKTFFEGRENHIWFIGVQIFFIIYTFRLILLFNRMYQDAELGSVKAQEKLRLEQQLQLEKLKAINSGKLASLGEMAAGIAHEINNPLSIILGRIEIIKEMNEKEAYPAHTINEFVQSLSKLMNRITEIVNSMKNLSRIKDHSEFDYFALNDLVKDVLPLIEHKLDIVEIKLNIKINETNVYADKGEVSQILLNLINNSIDAIEVMNGSKWIEISNEVKEDTVLLRVTDSGDGIPKHHQNKLFEPFYTSKEVGKGTGLGLSLSKNLVLRNKGDLYLDTEHPNTSFVIILPKESKEN